MVSDVYFPRVNGVSSSIETFARALPRHGVEVTLIAPDYGVAECERQFEVIRVASRRVPRDPEDRLMAYRRVVALGDRLAARGFDLVHVDTPFVAHYAGVKLARRLNLPCVATYHTFFEEYLFHYAPFLPRGWLKALARRYSRTQCNALDRVIVPSTAMRDVLTGYGVVKPMQVLPTGIPLERFHGGDGTRFRARLDIAAQRPVALFVGRVAFEKNIDFLIDVARHVRRERPDFLLLIAGEGPALPALQRRAADLRDSVRFIGYLDRDTELVDCYRAADAFVFASRTETQGLVLLEAMALGVPVVALAEMGTRDVLAPESGAVTAPDDIEGFAVALLEVLNDPQRREAMAAAGQTYAQTWRTDVMAERMAALYRRAAGQRLVVTDAAPLSSE